MSTSVASRFEAGGVEIAPGLDRDRRRRSANRAQRTWFPGIDLDPTDRSEIDKNGSDLGHASGEAESVPSSTTRSQLTPIRRSARCADRRAGARCGVRNQRVSDYRSVARSPATTYYSVVRVICPPTHGKCPGCGPPPRPGHRSPYRGLRARPLRSDSRKPPGSRAAGSRRRADQVCLAPPAYSSPYGRVSADEPRRRETAGRAVADDHRPPITGRRAAGWRPSATRPSGASRPGRPGPCAPRPPRTATR